MKNKLKNKIVLTALCLSAALTSCSDWTETKSIDIREADIEKDDPELYGQYLANLRNYRQTDHKVLYAWFDNTKGSPVSRGQHLNSVPDSIDVINLMNPDELPSWTVTEMNDLRKDKGMRFVFSISYPDLEKEYEQYLLENPDEDEGETDSFLAYASSYVDRKLALTGKYGYDGVSVLFYGMKTNHLTEEAKARYLAREEAFMSKFRTWTDANKNKMFIFEGHPQNITDKSILPKADFIVVRSELLKYASGLTFEVLQTIENEVPTDRFLVTVNTTSLDPTDTKTGYYINSENETVSCIPVAAEWVCSVYPGFTKYGLAILNVQNDYYNSGKSYRNVRNAISTMNPSPKF